jgi:hypothetical protein
LGAADVFEEDTIIASQEQKAQILQHGMDINQFAARVLLTALSLLSRLVNHIFALVPTEVPSLRK